MTKELSTELITHKLKIKWEWVRYISKKMAENIFNQLSDNSKWSIVIANPETLTFITKYRSEVDLLPLDKETKDFEDILYMSWLSDNQKERVREIRDIRKQEKKQLSKWILDNIIISINNWKYDR